MLLYAERLIGNDRPGWRPIAINGPSWDYYELVRQEHGQPAPPPTEMRFMVDDTVARLRREVVEPLKTALRGPR